jgi:hypothetical protein
LIQNEQTPTTLNRYTHTPDDYAARVLDAFAGPADSALPPEPHEEAGDDEEDDRGAEQGG